MTDVSALIGLFVAALGGAAIGVERQWSGHASGRKAHFAGVRTFTLLGCVAGSAGVLARSQFPALSVVLVTGLVALIVVAYAAASRRDVDATTEVAALVTVSAGLLAGLGSTALASGITATTVLLLVEKPQLHKLVARIADKELRAAARFAVMAIVVLPLLPSGPYGPLGAVKPRELWMLVLFFTGLSFIGYLARRVVGAEHGYPLSGALAGLISSTNATFTFARLSCGHQAPPGTLATGAIAASTVLFPRVVAAAAVLDRRVAWALLPYLGPPFLLGLAIVAFWLRTREREDDNAADSVNPLQLWPALQMAATFQAVLFIVAIVRQVFGDGGLLLTGAVLGLTDVDALTISMAKTATGGIAPTVAAQAIALGILTNCGMKAAIATVLGTAEFGRRAGGALALMVMVLALALGALR